LVRRCQLQGEDAVGGHEYGVAFPVAAVLVDSVDAIAVCALQAVELRDDLTLPTHALAWRELIKHGPGVCSTQWRVLCRAEPL